MLSADHRLAQTMMEQRTGDMLRRAEARGLLRQAGVVPKGRLVRQVVCRLALLLVAVGARLVRLGLPAYQAGEADLRQRGRGVSPV
jgi:hypothetical protein